MNQTITVNLGTKKSKKLLGLIKGQCHIYEKLNIGVVEITNKYSRSICSSNLWQGFQRVTDLQ